MGSYRPSVDHVPPPVCRQQWAVPFHCFAHVVFLDPGLSGLRCHGDSIGSMADKGGRKDWGDQDSDDGIYCDSSIVHPSTEHSVPDWRKSMAASQDGAHHGVHGVVGSWGDE